jgi:hypothetical protein
VRQCNCIIPLLTSDPQPRAGKRNIDKMMMIMYDKREYVLAVGSEMKGSNNDKIFTMV